MIGLNGIKRLIYCTRKICNTCIISCRYIFSLALADLLVILICVPFVSIIYTLESWPWGELICRISEAGKDVSIGVSVFTLTALSAERYCAIVNPFRKLQVSGIRWFVFQCVYINPYSSRNKYIIFLGRVPWFLNYIKYLYTY